jgi:hypothetical protein
LTRMRSPNGLIFMGDQQPPRVKIFLLFPGDRETRPRK